MPAVMQCIPVFTALEWDEATTREEETEEKEVRKKEEKQRQKIIKRAILRKEKRGGGRGNGKYIRNKEMEREKW